MSALPDVVSNVVIVAIVIGLCIFIDAVIMILAKILTPSNPPSVVKVERFESGNLPFMTPKYSLPMQYTGYLLVFLGVEPIVVLLFILAPLRIAIPLIGVTFVMLTPAIYAGYRLACEAAYAEGEKCKEVRV